MEEKNRKKEDAGENDFDPDQGRGKKIAVDHDQFADVPGRKGEHQEGKNLVYDPPRIVKKNNQAESQVDGQGQGCGYGVDAHLFFSAKEESFPDLALFYCISTIC